jgi:hypothetical protein
MIKFKLVCKDCTNTFDSWFSESKEYEKLKKKKFLTCNICNSANVQKTLMSPNILNSKNSSEIKLRDDKYKEIKKKITEYQKFIQNNFDYVGRNFAYEARSIHYKDKKVSKGIYGSTTKAELKALKEEGIEIEEIPWLKDKTN